ncbi:MAG: glycosyltransferase family 4 protein [Bacteriovoracaceae bacterium]|jgi:colanic acid biosynthesis glycosyl transferase WcaI|nr:glycosyltransferase family 4 protein [Bacteriovoracaceae bacterium]
MKILIVTQYFWPEGFRVNDLATGLRDRGHQVSVLTGMPNYPQGNFFEGYSFFGPSRESYEGIDVFRVPLLPRGSKKSFRLLLNYLSFALFASFLGPFIFRKHKFDKIFVFEVSPITVGLPGVVMKYLKKAQMFFWVTDLWPETLLATNAVSSKPVIGMVGRLVKFLYGRSDKVLVPSKGYFPNLKKYGAADKSVFWPYWAEELFEIENNEDVPSDLRSEVPKGFVIMFAGNLGTSQALDSVIEASHLIKDQKDIKWVFLGDGLMRKEMEQKISELGLQENVYLLGRKSLEQVPAYYKLADVLLVSLKTDPLFEITIPSKIQSYFASSKPILASIDGEGARIVEESKAGFSCPSSDSKALADTALKFYNSSTEELELMGTRAREYYDLNFKRAKLFDQLENLFEETKGE